MFMLAPDLVYRTQRKFFPITREIFDMVIYGFLGLFKIFFIVFNLVPFLALLIVGDAMGTPLADELETNGAAYDPASLFVIASGGAGELEHFADVFTHGHADAALAASIFHFADTGVSEVKRYLHAEGIPVRL